MFTRALNKTRPTPNQTLTFGHVLMRSPRMPVQLLAEDEQLLGRAGERQSQPMKKIEIISLQLTNLQIPKLTTILVVG